MVVRLPHYIAKHQTDWNLYVHPLPYAYNAQLRRPAGTTQFTPAMSCQPPCPATANTAPAIPGDMMEPALFLQLAPSPVGEVLRKQMGAELGIGQAHYKHKLSRTV